MAMTEEQIRELVRKTLNRVACDPNLLDKIKAALREEADVQSHRSSASIGDRVIINVKRKEEVLV